MEVEEDLSSWDDLYGSSHDLVPSLLNIFDAMIAQTSLRATEADLPLKLRPESPESPTSSHIVSNVPSTTPGWSNGPTSPGTRKGYPVLRIIEPGDPVEQTRIESPTLILKKQSTLQNGQMQSSTGAINVESSNADCATSKDRETSKRLQYTDVIKRKLLNDTTLAHRPSSSSSSSSSSSLTSVASSVAPASYLASIESLTDKENTVTVISSALRNSAPHARFTANEGQRHSADSGDSGVCSPGAVDSTAIGNGSTRHAGSSDVIQLSYMDRVVMEIVETETVYVRDLEDVVEGYLNYWAQAVPSPLNEDESKNLFSNINQIYAFNAAFLKELRSCELDPVEIARCFVRNNTGFTIYTEYCTNYPRTVSVLTDLMRVEATARAFRERQTSLQHTLPLGSYLLKPVQRILKYHLLLQNIVKHYDRTSDGYADILVALSAMTGIAHHINDMKRRHEHAVRVQEIQSLLYGWQGEDLTTYGELVAEGHFRLYGAKALRHVFLFDQMLLICKRKEDGTLSYKTHIMCSNLMLIESVNGEPLSFHVVPFDNPRLQYTLEARNMEQKREWTLQLKRVILENYHAEIPTHARQLVMQLGQERPERDVSVERNGPKRQHSAPEYLERRKHSTAGLKSKLRRSRKSSVTSPKESPLLPRRFRRSLDSSPSLADSNKDCKEIFRKCSTISCPPEMDIDKSIKWRRCSEQTNIPGSPSSSVDFSMQESRSSNTLDAEETEEEDVSETRPSEESLEKIVGQLVLQNRDIQRILLRQRRKRFEPADSKSLQDHSSLPESQESICESLSAKSFESDDATLGAPLHPNDPTDTEDKDLTALKRNCPNRRSLGTCTSLTPQPAPVPNIERSLSCPARQKVQIRKSVSLTRKVSNVIHCDLAHWQEVLRSLSPHRRLNFLGQSKPKPPPPLPDSVTSNHSKVTAHESENPNVPEVWLRLQEEHLSSAQLKSGSLPRSFSWQQDASKRNRDRPVTIASDKPDLHEDYESYRMSLEETRSVDFSSESLQDQELSYPDYRIYRRSPSRSSLRAVIHSVSNKIAHMKSSDLWSSWFNLTEEEKQTKWISTLSRQYSQIMKQRVRSRPSQVDLHHQTATVGARIANTDLADYAVPCVRPKGESCFTDLNSSQDKISDSMYSLSSGLGTNESESSGTLNSRRTVVSSHFEDEDSDLERSESELSNDSFYERSFEAIESLLDQEVYRDSAIFSDKDDLSSLVSGSNPSSLTRGIDPSVLNQENPVVRGKASVPPPVPAKPSRALLQNLQMDLWKENAIADRVKLLEENSKFKKTNGLTSSLENLKSIQERRKELETFSTKTGDESETSSQHSTSTVNTVLEVHFNPSASGSPEMDRSRPSIRYAAVQRRRGVSCDSLANRDSLPVTNSNAALPKGWVKHIIGRLQGDS